MKSGTPQSTIGNSMVSLTSFQFSIVKSPVLPPDKISPITMLRVRRVFADKVEFRLRDSLCTLPSFNVMSNSSGGVSEDGNTITVALLISVPSSERFRSNLIVFVMSDASAV